MKQSFKTVVQVKLTASHKQENHIIMELMEFLIKHGIFSEGAMSTGPNHFTGYYAPKDADLIIEFLTAKGV